MNRMAVGLMAAAGLIGGLAGGCTDGGTSGDDRSVQATAGAVEWPVYAADQGGTHYSPVSDINRDTVSGLAVAWEWETGESRHAEAGTRPGNFQNTPLMIDDVLYVSTPYNRVVALDASTGAERWSFDPMAWEDGQPANGTGFVHRGVAAWRDGAELRIFLNSRHRLFALDGATGAVIPSFGTEGVVDLSVGLRRPINRRHYTNTSPPVVYGDLVIVGNGVGDRLMYRNDPPGDVRAFNVHTGEQVWQFHTVPLPGQAGHDTWEQDSWEFTGHTNVWAPMSLDAERGLLYLPVSTPSNDYYGGSRPGANLFAESIVCLDAATGVRKWHFQILHHGLWDYDLPAAPILVTIDVEGRAVDAVVQLTKQGFAFVFDRVTGEPVWPIEERPVGASQVPGEQSWPTQPFPSLPEPFAPQGASADDVFDLTPELREQALAALAEYDSGPLYTPPSTRGTVLRPGIIGGANWGGGAFDASSQMLYVKTSNLPFVIQIAEPDIPADSPRAGEVDAELIGRSSGTSFTPAGAGSGRGGRSLPIFKPPYGELVALNLRTGRIAWQVPAGDYPSVRNHPLLQDVPMPSRLGSPGAPGTIVTAGGLLFVGGGDRALRAFDASTGDEVWAFEFPRPTTATPMTYRTREGRQFVVIATGGRSDDGTLVAFALR